MNIVFFNPHKDPFHLATVTWLQEIVTVVMSFRILKLVFEALKFLSSFIINGVVSQGPDANIYSFYMPIYLETS